MPYQKPQVLADNRSNVPHMMPCQIKSGATPCICRC